MENENIVKETALSVAKETAKDVYADTVQPTAKNVGGFFGTLSGFFNHVVMYPLKKLNNSSALRSAMSPKKLCYRQIHLLPDFLRSMRRCLFDYSRYLSET